MNLIAAPEGVKVVREAHPDVDIYVAALDERRTEFVRHFPRQREMLRLRLVPHRHDDCVLINHHHVLLNIFASSPPVNRKIVGLP